MWNNISGFTSKAAEAISRAKDQIKELAEDQSVPQLEEAKNTIYSLETKCDSYRKQFDCLKQENQALAGQINGWKGKILDFRVIIGSDDSPGLIQEIERNLQVITQLETAKQELHSSFEATKQQYEDRVVQGTEEKRKLDEEVGILKKYIGDIRESVKRDKGNKQKILTKCYSDLKESFIALGLPPPSLKPETLALEDLQLFLSVQPDHIRSTVTELTQNVLRASEVLTGNTILTEPSLEGVKSGITQVLTEAVLIVQQSVEAKRAAEGLLNKTISEISELKEKVTSEEAENASKESLLAKNNSILDRIYAELDSYKLKHNESQKLYEDYTDLLFNHNIISTEIDKKQAEIKQLKHDSSQLKILNVELHSKVESHSKGINDLAKDRESLQKKLETMGTELKSSQAAAKRLQQAEAEITQYKSVLDTLQATLKNLETQLERKVSYTDSLLQEIDQANNRTYSLESKEKALKKEISSLYTALEDKNSLNEQESSQELVKAEKLKEEAGILLNQADDKCKNSENSIDKRVVSTFIVNLLNPENSENVKLQMVSTLANMLDFDEAQKRKVGLITENTIFSQLASYIANG